MKNLIAVALLFAMPVLTSAQSKPLVLKNRTRTDVAFQGFRSFLLPSGCDEQERAYVMLDDPDRQGNEPLLKISSKGVLETQFDTTGFLMQRYAVRPQGGVLLIRVDNFGRKFIENFSGEGVHESTFRVERPPSPFFPNHIAVFRTGEILMSGPGRRAGDNALTTLYDSTGHVVKQFVLDGDSDIGHEAESRSLITAGDDGLVYLLRATSPARLYVISPEGEVVRKIVVSTITGSMLLNDIRVTKDHLVLSFYRHCDPGFNGCRGLTYLVMDAKTGQKLAEYAADGDMTGPLGCYVPDPDRFYTFWITPTEHRLDIVEASAQ
jgi:hypothetical protein